MKWVASRDTDKPIMSLLKVHVDKYQSNGCSRNSSRDILNFQTLNTNNILPCGKICDEIIPRTEEIMLHKKYDQDRELRRKDNGVTIARFESRKHLYNCRFCPSDSELYTRQSM